LPALLGLATLGYAYLWECVAGQVTLVSGIRVYMPG
jgi:hypothetical protein